MKTRDEVLVGLVITAAIVVTVLGSLWLARGGLSKGYPLYAKFPWGAGLKQGQPVLLVGVASGYVDEVDLHQDGTLVTTLRIQNAYNVPVTSKELSEGLLAEVERQNAALEGTGRILVRPSGTEPLVRVLAEAETVPEAEKLCATIGALVRRELG